jgi:hypothetical protein
MLDCHCTIALQRAGWELGVCCFFSRFVLIWGLDALQGDNADSVVASTNSSEPASPSSLGESASSSKETSRGSHVGLIAGLVVGAAIIVCLALAAMLLARRVQHRRAGKAPPQGNGARALPPQHSMQQPPPRYQQQHQQHGQQPMSVARGWVAPPGALSWYHDGASTNGRAGEYSQRALSSRQVRGPAKVPVLVILYEPLAVAAAEESSVSACSRSLTRCYAGCFGSSMLPQLVAALLPMATSGSQPCQTDATWSIRLPRLRQQRSLPVTWLPTCPAMQTLAPYGYAPPPPPHAANLPAAAASLLSSQLTRHSPFKSGAPAQHPRDALFAQHPSGHQPPQPPPGYLQPQRGVPDPGAANPPASSPIAPTSPGHSDLSALTPANLSILAQHTPPPSHPALPPAPPPPARARTHMDALTDAIDAVQIAGRPFMTTYIIPEGAERHVSSSAVVQRAEGHLPSNRGESYAVKACPRCITLPLLCSAGQAEQLWGSTSSHSD